MHGLVVCALYQITGHGLLPSYNAFLTPFLSHAGQSLSCTVQPVRSSPKATKLRGTSPVSPDRNIMAPRNDDPRPPPLPRLYSLSHASKRSFLSHSSSFEADDERSTSISRSSDDIEGHSAMSPRHSSDSTMPPLRYPGEDTRRKFHIAGFGLCCK